MDVILRPGRPKMPMAAATVFAVLKSISSLHNFPCDTPRRKSVWGRLPPSICLRSNPGSQNQSVGRRLMLTALECAT
jgi:hypothetical protein